MRRSVNGRTVIVDGPAVFAAPSDGGQRVPGGAAPERRVLALGHHDVAAALAVHDVGRDWAANKQKTARIRRIDLLMKRKAAP